MEIIFACAAFSAVIYNLLHQDPPAPKSPEQQLGEAISNYLTQKASQGDE